MAFDNDSFIREVNEELRSDQMKTVWKRFGKVIIGLAVLIVVGTAADRAYNYWNTEKASEAGDRFLAALQLASENKAAEAKTALEALEKEGHGAYPVLARLRAATLAAEGGDVDGAMAGFAAIAADTTVAEPVRNVARLRAAFLMVDTQPYDKVAAEVEPLAVAGNAMRHSAREALGLSAYRNGDFKRAREWFQQIVDDAEAPRNVGSRAQMLLDVMNAAGKA